MPKNIQMEKNFFANARGSTLRAGVVRRPRLRQTPPADEGNKKHPYKLKLRKPLKVDTIVRIIGYFFWLDVLSDFMILG